MRRIYGLARVLPCACFTAMTACHALDANADLPVGTRDPSAYNTPSGAVQQAQGARGLMRTALSSVVTTTGIFTDELDQPFFVSTLNARSEVSPDGDLTSYGLLQQARGQARLARGELVKYAPKSPPALRGEMYALEGYEDIYLADIFCSGVPLSTIDFEQSFTYEPGSPTRDVYRAAAALLDSALALSHDSINVDALARVGLARALLAVGSRDSAAKIVASVPDSAKYTLRISSGGLNAVANDGLTASIREGGNGLAYGSGDDPRTPMISVSGTAGFRPYTVPWFAPYGAAVTNDSVSVTIASGIEARLIKAEAELAHGGTTWLATLNRLRTDGNYTTSVRRDATSGDSIGVDTMWNAGTGGVAGLRLLRDPGSDTARVSLLFQERGYWLYLTGHRQGDLRRLVRATTDGGYGRPQFDVYPVGVSRFQTTYGNAVSLPIPSSEEINPLYKGCLNHGA